MFHPLFAVILGNMSKPPRVVRFSPGDRVAERPKASFIVVHNPATLERIRPNLAPRFGTVVGYKYQVTKNKRETPYVEVMWDHRSSSALHAQSRLCLEAEFEKMVNEFCAAIEP